MVIEMWEMTATTAPNVLIDDMQPASGLPRNIHHHPMECCMVIARYAGRDSDERGKSARAIVFILDYACVR